VFYYAWEPSGKGGGRDQSGRESCTRVLEHRGLSGGSSVPEVAIRGGWDGGFFSCCGLIGKGNTGGRHACWPVALPLTTAMLSNLDQQFPL